MTDIVKTIRLSKVIGGKAIVSDVNMRIGQGQIYGFLGPNGAGKTTVMRMLTGLVKPTEGEIELFGAKLAGASHELLRRIGSIIEYPVFYDKLTALENMELHCEYMGFYNKKAIGEALELVHLHNIDNKPVKEFSLGMKQRLGIARAIVTKPELLLFDEPTNGLDPVGIRELRDLFKLLCKEYGTTMLISSHILGEIEQIADTIGVIAQGRLVKEVSMDSIRSKHTEYIEIVTADCRRALVILENKLGLSNYKLIDDRTIRIYDESVSHSSISKALILGEIAIESINTKRNSLEEYFFEMINGGEVHA